MEVIAVISSGIYSNAEEVDLSFISDTKPLSVPLEVSFFGIETVEIFFGQIIEFGPKYVGGG